MAQDEILGFERGKNDYPSIPSLVRIRILHRLLVRGCCMKKNRRIVEPLVWLPPYLDLRDPANPAPECKNSVRKLNIRVEVITTPKKKTSIHDRYLANEEDRKHHNLPSLSFKKYKGGER